MESGFILPHLSADFSLDDLRQNDGNIYPTQSENVGRDCSMEIHIKEEERQLFVGRMDVEMSESLYYPKISQKDPLAISPIKVKKSNTINSVNMKKVVAEDGESFPQSYGSLSQIPRSSESTPASTSFTGSTSMDTGTDDPNVDVEIKHEVGELFMGSSMNKDTSQTIFPTGHFLIQTVDHPTFTTTRINVPTLVTETGQLFYVLSGPPISKEVSTENTSPSILQKKNSTQQARGCKQRKILPRLDAPSVPLRNSSPSVIAIVTLPSVISMTLTKTSIHTSRRRYYCKEKGCNKSYLRSDGLRSHMSTHTGVKHYKCNVCGKEFAYRHCLNRHLQSGHNKKQG